MLETTLIEIERVVAQLLEQNQSLTEKCSRLEQELLQSREENDSLQLVSMELEEKQNATLARLQALVERAGSSNAA